MAPTTSNFQKEQSFQIEYSPCKLTRYVSNRSGMHVFVVDRKGPMVDGCFVLATEILDNSGAPHTLEHLVFTSSKNYPYRGLLDKVSSKLFSTTNAWTATDHTAYTLETAGWEAFSGVMPLYLENVLQPLITDATVATEVWNIDGEGNDGGVVYSEMQAVENTSESIIWTKLSELLYPEDVGFRYETGGLPAALRSLTRDRIVDFHKAMYQFRNLGLIITGEVDHDNLIQILNQFEEKLKDAIPPPDFEWKRPWIDSPQPPPLPESITAEVTFPEEDESRGSLAISWFGPHASDHLHSTAISILFEYLSGSSASILMKTLVEEEHLASYISFNCEQRPNSVIVLSVDGVPTEKLGVVHNKISDLLSEVHSNSLDMQYLLDCIHLEDRKTKFEADGHSSYLQGAVILDFLFGKRDGTTFENLKTLDEYSIIEGWTEAHWKAFMKKWLLDAHSAAVLGKPSQEMAARLKASEEARLKKRREELGEEGLRKAAEKLEQAKQENTVDIPESVLGQWKTPSADSIPLLDVDTGRSGLARKLGPGTGTVQKLIDAANTPDSSLFVQFEEVSWKFVEVIVHVTLARVPEHLLPLVSTFAELITKSPIRRNGELVDYEQVVKEIQRDSISYSVESSGFLEDDNGLMFAFSIEPAKYATTIEWIRTLVCDTIMDPERLRATISKLLAEVPSAKRDGRRMISQVTNAIHLNRKHFHVASSNLVESVYLPRLKHRLRTNPDEVVGWFEEIRKAIFTKDNVRALVVGDIPALENPVSSWDRLTSALTSSSGMDLIPLVKPRDLLTSDGASPGAVGATIVPIAAIDSSYLLSTGKGLTSHVDPRYPAAMVAGAYLQMAEGPFWTSIRGQGLAYGSFITRATSTGLVKFEIYRSPDATKALVAARDIVSGIISGKQHISPAEIESAVSQVVSSYMSSSESPAKAGTMDYIWTVIRELPAETTKKHLAAISKVTEQDIRDILRDFILPLLTPEKSNVVVACARKMQEDIDSSLKKLGYQTRVLPLSHFADSYGFEGPEDEDSEGDDDDDGDDDEQDDEGEDDDEEGEE